MGVFARFLGKKQRTSEDPTTSQEPEAGADAPDGAEPDGPGPDDATEETAEAVAQDSGEDDGRSADARTEPERAAVAAESTEIPRQQSAKEAADNEVGEGART
ncbi:hypothetical protein [Streptomyces shenzhenensis]|uniref:hypothetical protein n=1 Tax=Streptomyces shenzhenensis TaxID=943815 RepID=UPI001C68D350|nr:hypothetical protein [Streptomyces shenzhenensis]